MRNIAICLLFTFSVAAGHAQVASINENFNSACNTISGCPSDWTNYNPISATIPDGQWGCIPGGGRYGTNGIRCTGVWGTPSAYHLDTAYLVSPAMNLSGDTGHVYLHFDTKVSNNNLGARLSMVITSRDTIYDTVGGLYSDRSNFLSPLFTNDDSTDWVTHVADLTPFKSSNPLYVAFRYTSGTTAGNTWYIDNVYTTSTPAGFVDPSKQPVGINVLGSSTSSNMTVACTATFPGMYFLTIYDVMGKAIHNENIFLHGNRNEYTMSGLSLSPGMYLVKLGNGNIYSTARAVVR